MNASHAIRERLAALQPLLVEIIDDSAKHAGHEGARGGGHYRLKIVSARFGDKRTVERHRMIYDALGDLMRHEVHALSIVALTPDENR